MFGAILKATNSSFQKSMTFCCSIYVEKVNKLLTCIHILTALVLSVRMPFMRGSRKFCQRGFNFDNVFLVNEGREGPSTTISGPSTARQQNAIKWRYAGVLMMAQH